MGVIARREPPVRQLILFACVALALAGSWFAADQQGLSLGAVAADVRGFRLGTQEEPATPSTKVVVEETFKVVNEALKTGKMRELDTVFAVDFVNRSVEPGKDPSLKGLKEDLRETRKALPDARYTVLDMIAEGEKVVVRCTLRGTPNPDAFNVPVPEERVEMEAIMILRIVDGEVVESRDVADELGLLEQLGLFGDEASS